MKSRATSSGSSRSSCCGSDIVYWFTSHDPTGTTAMALGVCLGILVATYLFMTGAPDEPALGRPRRTPTSPTARGRSASSAPYSWAPLWCAGRGRGHLRGRRVRVVDGLPGRRVRRTGSRLDAVRVLLGRGLSLYSEAACRQAVLVSAASSQIWSPLGRSTLMMARESGSAVLTRSHSSDSGMPLASRRMTGEVVMISPLRWL